MTWRPGGFSRRGFLGTAGGVSALAVVHPARGVGGTAPAGDRVGGDPEGGTVPVHFRVNGRPVEARADAAATALSWIRGAGGLTGTKEGCGHGACGACTAWLDGVPVSTCLLPLTALEGRELVTIEGLGPPVHAVQRAFAAEDALQCGYCTPGFVMEAAAFVDTWRATRGGTEPTGDEVAAALSGHLCRCGAYDGIRRAVGGACAGRYDDGGDLFQGPRSEAGDKVTGRARYTVDVRLPGQLVGRLLRSPHAHAVLDALDVTEAAALPGVAAIVPYLEVGQSARHVGQPVAAVAARDRPSAERALRAIQTSWTVRPAAIGFDAAVAEGAPEVWASGRKRAPNAAEGPVFPMPWNANLRGPMAGSLMMNEVGATAGIASARDGDGTLVSGTFQTQGQSHTALEPHACVAAWEGPSKLTVYASTQATRMLAEDIAARWDLREEDVHVLAEHVGGGFGAKATLQAEVVAAIDLARAARAPVQVAWDRSEELSFAGYRPATRINVDLAAAADGTWKGLRMDAWTEAGVGVGGGGTGFFARFMYGSSRRRLRDWDVVSHAPTGAPFRAPSGPPAAWALEQTVDDLAAALRMDPLALRRSWDDDVPFQGLCDLASRHPLWARRRASQRDSGRFRRGVGLAAATWFHLVAAPTEVELVATPDGRLHARCATQDIGTGTRTMMANAIAGVLGVDRGTVGVTVGDSHAPWGPASGGSQVTTAVFPAAEDAARRLAAALLQHARRRLGLRGATVVAGGLQTAAGFVSWADILARSPRTTVMGRRPGDRGGTWPVQMEGVWVGRKKTVGMVLAEVEVDTRSGRVRATDLWAGIGAGRIVAPALAEGQVRGAVVQGLGYALYEERRIDPATGRVLTSNLEDYRVPGLGDIPSVEVAFETRGREFVAGGAMGLGELATVPVAGAVGNAFFDATGRRVRDLPLRPDRVLEALGT